MKVIPSIKVCNVFVTIPLVDSQLYITDTIITIEFVGNLLVNAISIRYDFGLFYGIGICPESLYLFNSS